MEKIIDFDKYKNKLSSDLTDEEKNCVLEHVLEQMKNCCQDIAATTGTNIEAGYLWKKYAELFTTYYRQMNLIYPDAREKAKLFVKKAENIKLPYEDYKNSLPELPVAALTMVIPVYADMIRDTVFAGCPAGRVFSCIDFYYFVWEDIIERFRCLYHLEPISDDAALSEINQNILANATTNEIMNEMADLLERALLHLHLDHTKFLSCSEALWYLIRTLEN